MPRRLLNVDLSARAIPHLPVPCAACNATHSDRVLDYRHSVGPAPEEHVQLCLCSTCAEGLADQLLTTTHEEEG
jgi:hypothetical protein